MSTFRNGRKERTIFVPFDQLAALVGHLHRCSRAGTSQRRERPKEMFSFQVSGSLETQYPSATAVAGPITWLKSPSSGQSAAEARDLLVVWRV